MPETLPIFAQLPALRGAFASHHKVVLEAPPGAGKTTQVPIAMLEESWLAGRKILMLEPRRLAARGAAERMASQLGEKAGGTVGYRVRMESRVSAATRIEVITEGILARMLNDDPALSEVGLVIFDEFHERNLDGDLGLALTLEGQRLFGELRETPLKLLLMSATLNGEHLSSYLGGAPLLRSEGRQHPVECIHVPSSRREDLLVRVVWQCQKVLAEHDGNVLVFLPGQGEIRRVANRLSPFIADDKVLLAPLYGSLSLEAQRRAIAPPPEGCRKLVLATDIAESSLTIEGITVVIDSGLRRQAVFDARSGISRLADTMISQASAEQRAGRAGRQQAGCCYRLWSEEQPLAEHAVPEILNSELSSLYLQCLGWGAEPGDLTWLDAPPSAHLDQARELLQTLGALEQVGGATHQSRWRLTALGEAMSALPVDPRLARLLIAAEQKGIPSVACDVAALMAEREISAEVGVDLLPRLIRLRAGQSSDRDAGRIRQIRRQSDQYRRLLGGGSSRSEAVDAAALALLLAGSFPDRIARRRQPGGTEYQLSNGRAARLGEGDPLRGGEYLVALELSGRAGESSDVIRMAVELPAEALQAELAHLVHRDISADWDDSKERFVAEQHYRIGRLLLRKEPIREVSPEQRLQAVISVLRRRGLGLLNWTEAAVQLRARIALMAESQCRPGGWPDVSDEGLLKALDSDLQQFFVGTSSLKGLRQISVIQLLKSLLSWEQQQALEREVPEAIRVPSGSKISIDYSQAPPVLAVKLQEMFGCENTPRVAEGRQPLLIHLLSPARRPLQVTGDLAGFWRSSYHDVKKEMKGRYPKHPWPDDPLSASATAYTKARSNRSA